ncbi:preprotein translocase subunit YajC [Cellulomonas bogoriensis 69B4 = DSM 16987]|uniref:Preprotein translocase subunit YajC n=1 Tax=Cellulomonas bogoriensis 69B4 = DSM 16987 TaxID=1386082 RepID=A0A0A0BXA0_9CELL|nr:preprotein translocase subunit YajC [Cellulomonas bogoriensis 69B4 = DSM 16987]
MFALLIGVMWLMTSRGRKQQREAATFRSELEPGQEVMTGSGLFGTVVSVEGEVVTLEIAPGVTTRWLRPAIGKPPATAEPDVDVEDEDAVLEDPEAAAPEPGDDTTTR